LTVITATPLTGGRGVFSRILVGVDASEESLEAARQAALLGDVEGELTLMAVWDTVSPLFLADAASAQAVLDPDLQRQGAELALSDAFRVIAPYASPTAKLVRGLPVQRLIEEIEREQDSLIAVGMHGAGRLPGLVAGSTATELIHRSPCSVLVARSASSEFPRRLVVGIDGSPESAAAYAAARYLQKRFDADLTPVVAGEADVDERLVAIILGEHHGQVDDEPVEVLQATAADADLLVVGSRGLRGLKALGSVSERCAHESPCSTLIVREPAWQRVREELSL
jgi:nucleotide-binding universal stress UspA family protein